MTGFFYIFITLFGSILPNITQMLPNNTLLSWPAIGLMLLITTSVTLLLSDTIPLKTKPILLFVLNQHTEPSGIIVLHGSILMNTTQTRYYDE